MRGQLEPMEKGAQEAFPPVRADLHTADSLFSCSSPTASAGRRAYLVLREISRPWRPMTAGLAVVDADCASACGPARNAGDAHRCQRPADDRLGSADKAVHARNRQSLAELKATGCDNRAQRDDSDVLPHITDSLAGL